MPRVTKLEKQIALEQLAVEVLPMIKEKFVEDEKEDQRYEGFNHNGWYYRNFRQIYIEDLFEIYIERFTAQPGETRPVKRKDWNGKAYESVWIYKMGKNTRCDGRYRGKDTGYIYEGYSFQDFTYRQY